ncbi:PriCT-2 domain-containing protein [Lutimaribacter marinistellae]|uniref:PriCT-2 domain-containing protein n=1 Tax=Lutimaribacter marinistellae TaxID=1820329 RepID=A0ABV7TIE5_9RHOB
MNAQNPKTKTFRFLWDAGYTNLIPVSPPDGKIHPKSALDPKSMGKSPAQLTRQNAWVGMGNWQKHEATEQDIAAWDTWGANIGMQMGCTVVALDVDITGNDLAAAALQIVTEKYPTAPLRYGREPKFLALFKVVGAPIPSSRVGIYNGEDAHLVEVLGTGKQAVVWGVQPQTRKPYRWPSDLPSLDALPVATLEDLGTLREAILKAAAKMGYKRGALDLDGVGNGETSKLGAKSSDPELTAELLRGLKNDYSWDGWFLMGLAAAGAELGPWGESAFDTFSKGSSKYDEATTRDVWYVCCKTARGTRGAGTIHSKAKEEGLLTGKLRRRHARSVSERAAEVEAQRHAEEIAEIAGQLTGDQRRVLALFDLNDDLSAGVAGREAARLEANSSAPESQESLEPPKAPEPPQMPSTGGSAPVSGCPKQTHLKQLPPGLVGMLIRQAAMKAWTKTDTVFLPAALSCVAACSAHRFVVKTRAPTALNLQSILVAGTTVGKNDAIGLAVRGVGGNPRMGRVGNVGSNLGLLRPLFENIGGGVLWTKDEIGIVLQYIRASDSNPQRAAFTLLMELYGLAFGSTEPHTVKSAKDSIPSVSFPFLVFFGATTPSTLHKAIEPGDVTSGQLSRWALFRGPNMAESIPLTEEAQSDAQLSHAIKAGLERIRQHATCIASGPATPLPPGMVRPKTMLTGDHGKHSVMLITPTGEAIRELDEFRQHVERMKQDSLSGKRDNVEGADGIWGRALENALKIAGIIALGDWAVAREVAESVSLTLDHARWGIALATESVELWENVVATELAGSQDAEDEKYILGLIEKQAPKHRGWASLTHINRADHRKIGGDRRTRAIQSLLGINAIEEKVIPAKGEGKKAGRSYRPSVDDDEVSMGVALPSAQHSDGEEFVGMAPL